MSSPPYDEDAVVALITQVFDLYIQLCYMAQEDIVYPPNSESQGPDARPRHTFPPEVYRTWSELQLSRKVISLLERIPYLKPGVDNRKYPVYWSGCLLYFPIGSGVEESRTPPGIHQHLLPSEIALVIMEDRNGRNLIFDTEHNTIRVYSLYWDDPDYPQDDDDPRWQDFEYPHVRDHYRNWAAQPAPEFLQRWVDDIRELKSIGWFEAEGKLEGHLLLAPDGFDTSREITDEEVEAMPEGGSFDDRFEECQDKTYKYLKRTLQRDYGWPNNFQAERWVADHWDVWKTAASRYDPGD